jgi:PST family polysaccharide transporter
LTSTSITGGASVINILIGIVRTKVVAILLGPVGIGLIGLYQAFVLTATTTAGLGIATAASREIAQANGREDRHAIAVTRRALFLGTVLLAVMGGLMVWLLREVLATHIIGNKAQSSAVGWLAIAVSLSVVSASQMAVVQGMRQIAELAKLTVFSALLGAIGGLAVIWKFGQEGLVVFVIVAPAASVCVGLYFVRGSASLSIFGFKFSSVVSNLGVMAKLGLALFAYTILEQITFLIIRANIGNTLGIAELGYFQAGWTMAVMYLGVITGAMSSDFLPRVAERTGDYININKLINHQTEIGLLIATPVIIVMIGYTPIIIGLMYSNKFSGSVDLIRLLLLVDILKLISWPIGIALLGMGDSAAFARQGPVQLAILFAAFYFMLPYMGLLSVGLALLIMQGISFIWGYKYIFAKTGFRLEKKIQQLFLFSWALMVTTYFVCTSNEVIGAITATLIALAMTVFSYKDIRRKLKKI